MNKKTFFLFAGLIIVLGSVGGFWFYKNNILAVDIKPHTTEEIINLETQKIKLEIRPDLEAELKGENTVFIEDKTDTDEIDSYFSRNAFTPESSMFIYKNFLEPANKINPLGDRAMLSRCFSGADYSLQRIPSEKDPYFYGVVKIYTGCGAGKKFFDFRVNTDGSILEIFDTKSQQYISAKDWFRTAKPLS